MAPSRQVPPRQASFALVDTESWSPLQHLRTKYVPDLPPALQHGGVDVVIGSKTAAIDPTDLPAIEKAFPSIYGQPIIGFKPTDEAPTAASSVLANGLNASACRPLKVGVLFHGYQSPGAHSVVVGIFDSLDKLNQGSTLLGFLDGTVGLCTNNSVELTASILQAYRNQGGLDLLGRSENETLLDSEFEPAKETCLKLALDGLVLVGGCNTATNAAQLAEYFASNKVPTKVVAVPCTIDNDLKGPFIPVSAGFDTACRVYSELVSNICTDALSAEKYYFFIRLMGRRCSHIALECALRTQANMVILGEEVFLSKLTLYDITKRLCDAICARSEEKGRHHGVILFPDGLIEHIPEVHSLVEEINGLTREGVADSDTTLQRLSPWAKAVLDFLPDTIQEELLKHRHPDQSLRFTKIETEKLFPMLVEKEMERRTKAGVYKGKKFNGIPYYFGYQGRSALPSNFDCCYSYALGRTASRLVNAGTNGYIAVVSGLQSDISKWQPGGVPITALMTINRWIQSSDAAKLGAPAVNPGEMDVRGKAFLRLRENAKKWLMEDLYRNPGPLQFEGPGSDTRPVTLQLEGVDYFAQIASLEQHIEKVRELVRPGCAPDVLRAAVCSLENAVDVIALLQAQYGPSNGV